MSTKLDANQVIRSIFDENKNRIRVDTDIQTNIETLTGSEVSTIIKVNNSLSSTILLEENPNRKGFFLFNDSDTTVFIKFGPNASSNSFTFKINQQSFYEFPSVIWRGQISAAAENASGSIMVTEIE
jgi:hypothetical protein